MILVYGQNTVGNVIHAVIGPESEVWSDLHGSLTVDVTPLVKMCDAEKPVLLNISRCTDEAQTAHRMQAVMSSGVQYPFLPGTAVFAPQQLADDADKVTAGGVPQDGPAGTKAKKAKAVKVKAGKCSRCNADEADLVPQMDPAICFGCAKIDLYFARMDKPHGNTHKQGGSSQDVQ